MTWATSVPILVFLGLSVLELGPMYATDRRQTKASLNGTTLWQRRHKFVYCIGNISLTNTIQYNTNSISNEPPTPMADRGRITVSSFTVQFWSSAVNKKNVSSLRLNSGVERNCLHSIGSLFQARAAATEKALSPNLRLVLDDRTEGLPVDRVRQQRGLTGR